MVLISGSSSGIGASAAKLFARRGYKVVVTGSNEDRVKRIAQECDELSPNGYKVSDSLNRIYNVLNQSINHLSRAFINS